MKKNIFLSIVAGVVLSSSAFAQTVTTQSYDAKCSPSSLTTLKDVIKSKVLAVLTADTTLTRKSVSVSTQVLKPTVKKTADQLIEGLVVATTKDSTGKYVATLTGQPTGYSCLADVKFTVKTSATKKDTAGKSTTLTNKTEVTLKVPGVFSYSKSRA